jgi:hypothetical protein
MCLGFSAGDLRCIKKQQLELWNFFVTYKWHDLVSPNQPALLNCPMDLVIKCGLHTDGKSSTPFPYKAQAVKPY